MDDLVMRMGPSLPACEGEGGDQGRPIGYLERLGEIPVAFRVNEALNVSVVDDGLGGIALQETTVDTPWIKDYDAIGGGPTRWLGSST